MKPGQHPGKLDYGSFPIASRWTQQAFHTEEIKILFHIAFIMTKWKNNAIFILGRLLISINIKAENTGKQCKRSAMFVMGSSSGLTSFWSWLTVMVLGPQHQRVDTPLLLHLWWNTVTMPEEV